MALSEEELAYYQEQRRLLNLEKEKIGTQHAAQDMQAIALNEETKSMVKEQLSLNDELETIQHLLRGHYLGDNEEGIQTWLEPKDSEMIILTEHGVHLIMNTILFYLNKNTLLSNYETETIDKKMQDFATDLADTIFMEYEKVFKYPTFEECKEILMNRLDRKTELRQFALELAGKKTSKEKIKAEFVEEIENKIESEISKIREQVIKNKLKRFLILIREIQDAVHSTYLRAWNGAERRTLRQHWHISEIQGNQQIQPPKQKRSYSLNPFSRR